VVVGLPGRWSLVAVETAALDVGIQSISRVQWVWAWAASLALAWWSNGCREWVRVLTCVVDAVPGFPCLQ
jgi:hypothetical protein